MATRDELKSAFKMHGLSLKIDAARYLSDQLENVDGQQRRVWMTRLLANVHNQNLDSALVDVTHIRRAIQECSQQENDADEAFEVIDVFSVEEHQWAPDRKKLVPRNQLGLPKPSLCAGSQSKTSLFRNRYSIVLQRTERHEIFGQAATFADRNGTNAKFKLRRVEELLGAAGQLDQVIVFGLLSQMQADKYHLEDPTGSIELDLSQTAFHNGLFTENCVLLVEGRYCNRVLYATAVGHPPVEKAASSRSYFGNMNLFGGSLKQAAKSSDKMQHLELDSPNAAIVFVTEVFLDKSEVLNKLRRMFEGFSSMPPVCFVFSGNYCSVPHGVEQYKLMKDGFRHLAQLINEFPYIREQCQFVFVPGAQDTPASDVLPRAPLSASLTSALKERVPNSHFVPNPCRLRYCSQEIVVFREDITEKMCRNCVQMPSQHKDIPHHLTKTLCAQGHLTPLPIHASPVYWDYDHCLRLYPLPDLIVLADSFETFTEKQFDCIVTCTSSFSCNNFSFQVYFPPTKEVDNSRIQDD